MTHYDAVVIGAGQGGDPLARAWAQAGRKTALIERAQIGGTCVNTGCTPTKTMIASARVAYLARRGADFGVQTGAVSVDMAKVRQRKRDIVEDFRGGTEKKIESIPNLDLLRGDARFIGTKMLAVGMNSGETQEITADTVFINAGARPTIPNIDGLNTVPFLDNASIEELDSVPEHLLILGGGYIALEFGQMFRRFGSKVTIVETSPNLLAHEDDDVCAEMTKILREDGLDLFLETKATRAVQEGNIIRLTVSGKDREHTLTGSHLLVATGRTPNTDTLGLDVAGVEMDERGFVRVNDRLETNLPGIYALGDIKGGPQFTHISYDDFRILKANLLDDGHRTVSDRPVPYTVFTDPQLGRVGLTEQQARQQGKHIKVAKLPMSEVARALETDESRGFMKVVIDADTGQILGCAILGLDGGEIMAVLEMAMLGKVPYTTIRDGVFAHPTLAESLNNLFMTVE